MGLISTFSDSKRILRSRRSKEELGGGKEPFSFCGAGREFSKGKCRACPPGTFAPGWSKHASWKESLHGDCIPCDIPEIFEPNEKKTKCVASKKLKNKPPVLFLPGFLGSRLKARRIDSRNHLKEKCPKLKEGEWIQVWPPHWKTLSKFCFAYLLTIRTTSEGLAEDQEGWEIDTDQEIPLIDSGLVYGDLENLFRDLEWSFEPIPFDWRYAPGSKSWDEKFVSRLKTKIEKEYEGQKIALIGHSYGGGTCVCVFLSHIILLY